MRPPTRSRSPARLALDRKLALRSKICGIVNYATRGPVVGRSVSGPPSNRDERRRAPQAGAANKGLYHSCEKRIKLRTRVFQPLCTLESEELIASMSDRKYRQRGYQDEPSDRPKISPSARPAPEPGAPAGTRRIS